jgi:tetratricopeptide (TPR) repeat protein
MASVIRVRDTRSGDELAMKLLLPLARSDEARSRFRREFRSLSRLNHPNIISVYEWGIRGDRPWFTMDLIKGHTLSDEAKRLPLMPPNERFGRIEHILAQLTHALAYIHDRGIIHRDITPGNIMVRPDDSITLMDFGVVKDLGADLTAVGELVGTVAYISPEQIRGDTLDARADLYSLGTVLYLLLTGKRPFKAHSLQGYLEQHLHQNPKRPQEIDPLIPTRLDTICMRLMEKDPGNRYASAAHLLHLIGGRTVEEEKINHWPTVTVGRTKHKALLRDAMDNLGGGGTGAAFAFTGTSGLGKTRMLDLAELYAKHRGIAVGRGRCRNHDRPFGAFIGVYRSLGEDKAPPIVRQLFASTEEESSLERYAILAAFREYLLALAPCVIIIDELEKADPATAELIEYLIRNTVELHDESVNFVLAQESSLEGSANVLATLESVQVLHLEPLAASDVEELVLSLTESSEVALALAKRIHQESQGSPAFISEMLRGLVDDGRLVANEDTERYEIHLQLHEITRSRIPIPDSIRQSIKARLAPLSEEAVEIARILAVGRRRLSLDTIIEAAPYEEDDVLTLIDDLIDAQIVREDRVGEQEVFELFQSRMRDVILEGISVLEFSRRHRVIGETLENQFRHRLSEIVEELAYHFEQAELAPKAYTYLIRTAERHQSRSLYEESLPFLDRALQMEPLARPLMSLDEADRRLARVYAARARAASNAGRWLDALEEAQRALAIATGLQDDQLITEETTEVGIHLRNVGRIDEAEKHFRNALRTANALGESHLKPVPLYQLGSVLWTRGDAKAAENFWLESLQIATEINNPRHQAFAHNGLGILAACRGQTSDARRNLEKSASLFEEFGLLAPLSITQVNLVEIYYCSGSLRKALVLSEKTIGQAREIHNPYGIAIGLGWRAKLLYTVGRFNEAAQNATEALRMIEEIGSVEDIAFTLTILAQVDLEHGQPMQALERLERALPELQVADPEGLRPVAHALLAHALAQQGEVEQATEVLKNFPIDQEAWPHIKVRGELARGIAWRHIGHHRYSAAAMLVALEIAQGAGYRYYQFVAHHELSLVDENPDAREIHGRTAKSLGRSIAANLPRIDAKTFLEHRMHS